MAFIRNGVKETLGIGYKKISWSFELETGLYLWNHQVEKIQEEIVREELDDFFYRFISPTMKIEAEEEGEEILTVYFEGSIRADREIDEDELKDEIGYFLIYCETYQAMLTVKNDDYRDGMEIWSDDDLERFLNEFEKSLYDLDSSDREVIEKLYRGDYTPSEELKQRMTKMFD
jgi:hypothetical protein